RAPAFQPDCRAASAGGAARGSGRDTGRADRRRLSARRAGARARRRHGVCRAGDGLSGRRAGEGRRMIAQPAASHWIAGRPLEGDGPALPVRFPYTGEVIAGLREAAAPQVEAALAAAKAAQPAWAALKPVERGRVLLEAARLIRARAEEL